MNQADFDGLSPDGKKRIAKGITDLDNAIVAHHRRNPEIVDRPTPASDEALEKLIDRLVSTHEILNLTANAREALAAAVQAESRKLLKRITQSLPEIPALYERYEYKQGFQEAVKLTRALLDSEQQKLGGKS